MKVSSKSFKYGFEQKSALKFVTIWMGKIYKNVDVNLQKFNAPPKNTGAHIYRKGKLRWGIELFTKSRNYEKKFSASKSKIMEIFFRF